MNSIFDETMKKVRENLEILYQRLKTIGYIFCNPGSSLMPPNHQIENHIYFIEKNIGKIPSALSSFYRIVGSVDFTGNHPEWKNCDYPDPIFVYPIEHAVEEAKYFLELESPEEKEEYLKSFGSFRIPIAPDLVSKENVSGGMWYGIKIPNDKEDPDLLEEWHHTTFVNYLRICFEWGGFPSLESEKNHTWPIKQLKQSLSLI